MTPDLATQLSTVETGGRAVSDVAADHLEQAVPGCPGWDLAALVAHLGSVYSFVGEQVRRRAPERVPAEELSQPPEGDGLLGWFDEMHQALVATLRSTSPDEPVWTWGPEPNAAFFQRRMMHETAIHRHDAEAAVDDPTPIDPAIAVDGLDELFDVIYPSRLGRFDLDPPSGSLHLHRTDGEGEWMLRVLDGRLAVTHEHAKGDAAVRGPAADLLLLQWERLGPDAAALEVFGDVGVVRSWTALSA